MNTLTGKSVGIALLMAAGLLAALFAMGVFAPAGVGAHDPGETHPITGTTDDHRHAILSTLALTTTSEQPTGATPTYAGTPAAYALEQEDGTAYADADLADTLTWVASADLPKDAVTLLVTPTTPAGVSAKVMWNDNEMSLAAANDPATPHDDAAVVAIDLTDEIVTKVMVIVEDSNDTDDTRPAFNFLSQTYTINLMHNYASNSMNAGAAVRLNLMGLLTASTGDVISIKAASFGLPDTIDPSHVTIQNNALQMKATYVDVSGDTIEITIPDMNGDTTGLIGLVAGTPGSETPTMITIAVRAGITNPNVAGMYGITLNDSEAIVGDDAVDAMNVVKVIRSISLDPKKGSSSADVTVTGKGFSTGSATVFIDMTPGATDEDDPTYVANMMYDDGVDKVISEGAAITDGTFTATIAGIANPDNADMVTISAFDGANNLADMAAEYTFTAGVSVDPESISWGQTLTINISDNDVVPTEVRFGGNNNYKMDVMSGATAKQAKVEVPAGVPVGVQKVEILDSTGLVAGLSSTVEIKPLVLSISPSTVVPGQQVTITGSSFEKAVIVTSVKIGGMDADDLPSDPDDRKTTSGGNVSVTVSVPLGVGKGDKKVELVAGGRIGEGMVTVSGPSISVDPEESLIGTFITITGSGFGSNERVEVFYRGEIEEVGRADASGDIHIRLEVPSDAGIGQPNTVEVKVRNDDTIKASATHRTPGPMLVVTERAQAGGQITISGSNFQSFSVLSKVEVGGLNAMPSPAPETNKDGEVEFSVRVPRLSAGSHTVTVEDGSTNSATETFTVVDTPIVSTPQEVFESLGDRLIVVWRYNNDDQSWASYSPSAANPELNDLTGVSRGDIVWVQISEGEDVEFQGGTLKGGQWSLINLD